MPEFRKGDRVLATKGLGGWFCPTVPQGTTGVVVRVQQSFCCRPVFTVKFDNGRFSDAGEDDLFKAPDKKPDEKKPAAKKGGGKEAGEKKAEQKPSSCWW